MMNKTLFCSSTIAVLVLAIGLLPTYADREASFAFLWRFHPKVSTAMIVAGSKPVDRVLQHSLVFSPRQARHVLPALDKVLTKRHGWIRWEGSSKPSEVGEYVIYRKGGTHVSYMSERLYQHLNSLMRRLKRQRHENWPEGTKLLPTERGGCVVKYFHLKHRKRSIPKSADQKFVFGGSVRDGDFQSARSALDRAGIGYWAAGNRGLTSIQVRKSDLAHAKEVLKADALSHHYTAYLED